MPSATTTKAGRNEARKLMAGAFNNLGVATILAALLQPILLFVQQDRTPTLAAFLTSAILIPAAVGLFALARRSVRTLED